MFHPLLLLRSYPIGYGNIFDPIFSARYFSNSTEKGLPANATDEKNGPSFFIIILARGVDFGALLILRDSSFRDQPRAHDVSKPTGLFTF